MIKLSIIEIKTGNRINDADAFMLLAGIDGYCRYEDIGIQGDGTIVVFDKCGNFGYLDPELYEASIEIVFSGPK